MPWLTDRKWAHIRLEGQAFGDVPLNVELKLEVWDSPNSAGIVIDAVRCCKLALNHGLAGQLDGPSSYLMKSPHSQRPDEEARTDTEEFIAKYAGASRTPRPEPKRAKGGCSARDNGCSRWPRKFSIAHVTPYPWEAQDNEVNVYVARVCEELSRRGHRVLVLAPSRSQERVRASRSTLRAARASGGAATLLEGTDDGQPAGVAVGEELD